MRLTWLADTLRAAGLTVTELDGWRTRGRTDIAPQGVVAHHTAAGPHVADKTIDKILTLGRSDLAGPLCQLRLRRDGTWVVVAAGRANHNGYGLWGNDSIGIEADNDGVGEPWPPAQMLSYRVGVAAICRRYGWGVDRVKGHKETDPSRKIDPTFDMHDFRAAVSRLLTAPIPGLEESPVWFVLHDLAPSPEPTANVHWLVDPSNRTARVVRDPGPWIAPGAFDKRSVPYAGRVLRDLGYRIVTG